MANVVKDIQELQMDLDTQQMQQYESAINEFNLLIEKGVVKKRGYNIKTIEQSYLSCSYCYSNIPR